MIISVTLGGALSAEIAEKGVMERPPRASNQPLVGKHILFRTFWVTTLMVIAIIGIFEWSLSLGYPVGHARATAFTLLVTACVVYGINCRSVHEFALGKSLFYPNRSVWISVVVVMGLQALIVHVKVGGRWEGRGEEVAPMPMHAPLNARVQEINRFFSCETKDAENVCQPITGNEWGVIFAISFAIFFLVRSCCCLSARAGLLR